MPSPVCRPSSIPRGFRTDRFVDTDGNVLVERRWLDGVSFLDTTRTYDANGNVLTETDPEGNPRSWTYDEAGNRVSETHPDGRTWTFRYDATCQAETERCSPAGDCQTMTYDADCNLRFITDVLGNVSERRYNALGQVTEIIDPNGSIMGAPLSPAREFPPDGRTRRRTGSRRCSRWQR